MTGTALAESASSQVEALFTGLVAAWGEPSAEASAVLSGPPGPDLAAIVGQLDPADVSDDALVDVVAACERLTAWVAAVQARFVAEMVDRAGDHFERVPDELAAYLTMSRRPAEGLVNRATALRSLPDVDDALTTGAIDVRRADAIGRDTDHLSAEEQRDLVAEVLPRAPELTVPQLRREIRRADALQDPARLERRHRCERERRSVSVTSAPDGMAWLTAYLPMVDAATIMTGLDAIAARSGGRRVDGDDRSMDARRADALTDVFREVLDSGVGPDGPLPRTQHRRPHLSLVCTPDVLVPGALGIAQLEGFGPVPASVAREVAAEAEWTAVGVDPRTGEARGRSAKTYRPSAELARLITGRDVTCTFTGCTRPAVYCDIDHIVPFDPDRPAEEQTVEAGLGALCRRHHLLKTHHGWTPVRDASSGTVTWTAPTGHTRRRSPVQADPARPPASPPADSAREPTVAPTEPPEAGRREPYEEDAPRRRPDPGSGSTDPPF